MSPVKTLAVILTFVLLDVFVVLMRRATEFPRIPVTIPRQHLVSDLSPFADMANPAVSSGPATTGNTQLGFTFAHCFARSDRDAGR